ncbi:O-antigen ligase [Pseudorhodoferax sp. Leaf274]|uniref:O-antigen ligase family protein n=1 Tax=Pseudorhodoferax sp. Leaf274 TaxID=1736318 RepID=UPI00138EEF2C|nr:O-antigen ligase family protein [Pseudorhodoferax sp. Leaf274]
MISITKVLVVVSALGLVLAPALRGSRDAAAARLRSPPVMLAALAFLALSLIWTTVPSSEALGALGKHAKLLLIPILVLFLRTRREALTALAWFVGAQVFLLLSSWLLVLDVPVPWATADTALIDHAVFTNYLGQSIMTATLAGICWHLRSYLPHPWMRQAAIAVSLLALASTLFVMPGRTGHLVAIAVVSLALLWLLPRRLRLAGVLMPVAVAALLLVTSEPMRYRAGLVVDESMAFAARAETRSSSGERLNFWHRSVQAISERPWTGFGLGSFNQQYKRLDAGRGNPTTFGVRNPHQEFLLWGVEAGIGAMLLLCALLYCLYRDMCLGERPAVRAGVSAMAALLISCMFNSILFDAAIGDFFCVAIGLLMALSLRTASDPVQAPGRAA